MFQVLSSINKNFYDVFCSMSIVRILEERVPPTTVLLSCTPSRSLYALCPLSQCCLHSLALNAVESDAPRRCHLLLCSCIVRTQQSRSNEPKSKHTHERSRSRFINWRPLSIVKCNNERDTFVQSFLVWRSRRYHSESNGKKCLSKRRRRRRKSNISGTFYPWINCTFLHIRRIVSQCLCVCVLRKKKKSKSKYNRAECVRFRFEVKKKC